jgi:hypothetical protein
MASHRGGPRSNPVLITWDFVMDKIGAGADFLRVLRFPLAIFIPPIYPQSPSPIIRGWYNTPVVAALSKVPPHKLKKK